MWRTVEARFVRQTEEYPKIRVERRDWNTVYLKVTLVPMVRMNGKANSATARLRQDYVRLKKDPVPYVLAEPDPSDILEWQVLDCIWHLDDTLIFYFRFNNKQIGTYSTCFRHYVVIGPEKTPYEGGFYHGKLVFPMEFPFQPPSIYMTTPNGRFKVNMRLCLSISDYHPDTWNPAWSVSTILTGLLSFMVIISS